MWHFPSGMSDTSEWTLVGPESTNVQLNITVDHVFAVVASTSSASVVVSDV